MQAGDIPITPQFITAAQDPGAKQFTLNWSHVDQSFYNIYRNGEKIADLYSGGDSFTDAGIEYNTQYIYAVSAVNGFDSSTESPRSVPVVLTASPIGQPFATIGDLTSYWKSPDDPNRAEFLLNLASNRLRALALPAGIDLETKQADPVYRSTLQWVVLEAVKRALVTPSDEPSIESKQWGAGPYSENIKYVNPTGDLFFRKAELSNLGLSGNQRLGSISTTRTDIYSSNNSENVGP